MPPMNTDPNPRTPCQLPMPRVACLRAGYINVLVTDERTALFLLEEIPHG